MGIRQSISKRRFNNKISKIQKNKISTYELTETEINDNKRIYKNKWNYFMVFDNPLLVIDGYVNKIIYQDDKCVCFTFDNPLTKGKRFWLMSIAINYNKIKSLIEPTKMKTLYLLTDNDKFKQNVDLYVGDIKNW